MVEYELEQYLLGIGCRAEGVADCLDGRGHVDRSNLETQLARDDARDVQQILDEPRLERRIALDDVERTHLGRLVEATGAEKASPDEDRAERRPQLVRERGEEVVLEAVRVLRFTVEPCVVDRQGRAAGELLCQSQVGPPIAATGLRRIERESAKSPPTRGTHMAELIPSARRRSRCSISRAAIPSGMSETSGRSSGWPVRITFGGPWGWLGSIG